MPQRPPLTALINAIPASVPFVGPEAQERARGRPFRARIGANENGFGPSPRAIAAMREAVAGAWQYADPTSHDLIAAIAALHAIPPANVVVGEGIDGLLGLAVHMAVERGAPVVTSDGAYPTFNFHVASHGGALINGHREGIATQVKQWASVAGYVLVSIDYRLAPETQLPEIIRDVEDAFTWVRQEGPRLFRANPARIAVAGGSAGGYLTLTAGFRVKPRPTVLLALWGYGDLIGNWYSKPSPHARHHTIEKSREEAYRQVSGAAISDSRDRKGDGGAFYQHCRQLGTWPEAVSGWNPQREPENFHPYMPLKNVTKRFPPPC